MSIILCGKIYQIINHQPSKCSNSIFRPIRKRIIPPRISIFFPNLIPVFLPKRMPSMEKKKVVNPIMNVVRNNLTLIKAKLMPTINASILVASDIIISIFGSNGVIFCFFSVSFLKLSKIILPPIIVSNPNANQ